MISAESFAPEARGATRTEPAAHLALLAVQVFFSTLPIAAKYYVLPYMPPAGLVMLRVFGGAVVLLALARVRGSVTHLDGRDLLKIAGYAMLGVTINQLTPAEREAFVKATRPVYDKWKERIGADLVDAAEKAIAASR